MMYVKCEDSDNLVKFTSSFSSSSELRQNRNLPLENHLDFHNKCCFPRISTEKV